MALNHGTRKMHNWKVDWISPKTIRAGFFSLGTNDHLGLGNSLSQGAVL